LTPEQLKEYGRIDNDYHQAALALQAKRNEQFRLAVEKTKQLLDPSQRQKYEELIKDRLNPNQASAAPGSGVAVGNSRSDAKIIPEAE
jgi:hypothetical protein